MKELIPKDNYGVFADNHDTARVDSLYVAKFFEKSIIRYCVIFVNLIVQKNFDCSTLDSPSTRMSRARNNLVTI